MSIQGKIPGWVRWHGVLVLGLCLLPSVHAREGDGQAPSALTAQASRGGEIRFVKDVIYINVRSGPTQQDPTIAVIPSGVRMEVLERDKAHGTYRVRLLSGKYAGKEGWVLARFLSDEPIARDRLESAQERATALEGKAASLEQALSELRKARQTQDQALTALRRENQTLKRELKEIKAMSASAVEAHRQRKRLEQQLAEQGRRLNAAEAQAAAAEQKLYMAVAVAALLALGIGFYIGYTPVRREKRWRRL